MMMNDDEWKGERRIREGGREGLIYLRKRYVTVRVSHQR